MRESINQIVGGRLVNGFDYKNQAWVLNGRYVTCNHPKDMNCKCFGRIHAGVQTACGGEAYFNEVSK